MMCVLNLKLLLCIMMWVMQFCYIESGNSIEIELNSLEKIYNGLRNTVYFDSGGKSFPLSLTNNMLEPGPKIYIKREDLKNLREMKRVFREIRSALTDFYVNKFGIILADYLSQVEEIGHLGIDLEGNFKLTKVDNRTSKKKMIVLDQKLLKKAKFHGGNIIGAASQPTNYFVNGDSLSLKLIEAQDNTKKGVSRYSRLKLHVISSKVSNKIAICRCKVDKKRHIKLMQLTQTLLFAVLNTIDSKNSPWYSLPDFIVILLKDLLEISSTMKFFGHLYRYFKSTKEYFHYSRRKLGRKRKKYYLRLFTDRRNNYHTKYLLEILGVTLSFIGNIFYSFLTDFNESSGLTDFTSPIEVEDATKFKKLNNSEKAFSKQDLIFISEYINKLPNYHNCVIYPNIDKVKISYPGETKLSLC